MARTTTIKKTNRVKKTTSTPQTTEPSTPDMIRVPECFTLLRHVAAKESRRYAMSCVLFEIKGDKLIGAATDGRMLTKMSCDYTGGLSDRKVLIEAADLAKVKFPKRNTPIETFDILWAKGTKYVVSLFSDGQNRVTTSLVEATFPPYDAVIPTYPLDKSRRRKIGINPELLGRLMASMPDYVVHSFSRSTKPIRWDGKKHYCGLDLTVDYTGVIMPVNIT